jgi:hypothetical protein
MPGLLRFGKLASAKIKRKKKQKGTALKSNKL